ncbi:GntR family transcriptional regulator [Kribbella endophytica]
MNEPKPRRRRPWKIYGLSAFAYIAQELRQQIEDGRLRPNANLPSVQELQQKYDVSRSTVRSAVDLLRTEGLVSVVNGRGSFVRPDLGVAADVVGRRTVELPEGTDPHDPDTDDDSLAELRRVAERQLPPHHVLAALDLSPGTEVIHVMRVLRRPTNSRVIHHLYFPVDLLPGPPSSAPTGGHFYQRLIDDGMRPEWVEDVMARHPDPDEAQSLAVPRTRPILITRRTTAGQDGAVVALEETLRGADDNRLSYRIPAIPKD